MSTQFKIESVDFGDLSIFAILAREDGTWEPDWEPLRISGMTDVLDLLSPISYVAYSELRARYVRPFMDEIGLSPKTCLMKLSEETALCFYRESCPSYSVDCTAKRVAPICYDPSVEVPEVRYLVSRLIDLWRLGFYTITVTHE